MRLALAIAAAGFALAGAEPAAGAPRARLAVEYGIYLGGLPLGTADLAGTFDERDYKLEIRAKLTGLAGMLTSGRGAATAAGALGPGRPQPSSFAVTARSSKEQRTIRIGLNNGNVAAVEIAPPIEPKPDTVPLADAHKRGVIDPASAVLMPLPAKGEPTDPANCNRTIPVFDGAARFDIVLSFAETRGVEKPGYSGPVLVCNIRYVPISGHRTERPATKFMTENRDMQVWLAPVAGARLLVPLRIAVGTMVGPSLIEATRWRTEGADGAGSRDARAP